MFGRPASLNDMKLKTPALVSRIARGLRRHRASEQQQGSSTSSEVMPDVPTNDASTIEAEAGSHNDQREVALIAEAIVWSKVTAQEEEFLRGLFEKELREAIEASRAASSSQQASGTADGPGASDKVEPLACASAEKAFEEEVSAALELSSAMDLPDAVATLASFLPAVPETLSESLSRLGAAACEDHDQVCQSMQAGAVEASHEGASQVSLENMDVSDFGGLVRYDLATRNASQMILSQITLRLGAADGSDGCTDGERPDALDLWWGVEAGDDRDTYAASCTLIAGAEAPALPATRSVIGGA